MTAVVTAECDADREYSIRDSDEIGYTGVDDGGDVRDCPRCESRVFVSASSESVTHFEARWDSAPLLGEESTSLVLLFPSL